MFLKPNIFRILNINSLENIKMSQKIVLMACGSYSPPTYMHLRMFEIAKDYFHSFGLGTVIGGIMSPVHDDYKKKDLVAAHHRVAMLKLALRSSSWVKVSEWETRQAGWTRTRMSLQHHQDVLNDPRNHATWLPDDVLNLNNFNNRIDDVDNLNGNTDEITVKLLCGADLLESFATPGLWSDDDVERIVGGHGLVVVTRAGCDPARFVHDNDLLYRHRRNITLITNYIANEVSSTVVRRAVRRGESAKYLTDDAVIDYIHTHGLYGAGDTTY
ncbi:nicotinamide/nicotinic acid mononucleotide adenylyltransferase 3 isoform X2 [Aricia agestis]|uniref:nicotinamide/nicotinic acid mononucleotide adenylyltransferase 3 isoform X2 n=1 Tax=Aricia agestis TaxID=91739 RepID=UPI001C20776C|nr:nicotinamide/nicotinic acid mononucleotide adenylyltransferase 3 isoform X2 [Aricia agestis]